MIFRGLFRKPSIVTISLTWGISTRTIKTWTLHMNVQKWTIGKRKTATKLGNFLGMSFVGNVIKIVRSTGSDYWAAYVGGEKSKQMYLNNTPKPMSLPINDLSSDVGLRRTCVYYHTSACEMWVRKCVQNAFWNVRAMCVQCACVQTFLGGAICASNFAHFLQQNGQNLLFFHFFLAF